MCLAIPGKLISIDENIEPAFRTGKVSFDGVVREVNLSMVPEACINEYVLVHVGTAIGMIEEEEAKKVFDFLKQNGEMDEIRETEKPVE